MPFLSRLRLLRQPGERYGRDPGDERLPGRHQETQGSTEAVQGVVQALLRAQSVGHKYDMQPMEKVSQQQGTKRGSSL